MRIFDGRDGLIQSVADNFDADINSPNGKLSTHSLALLLTQPEIRKSTINTEKIRRISKLEMILEKILILILKHVVTKALRMLTCQNVQKVQSESFNQVVPKIVKTMGYSKKHIKHGEKKIFDTSVIFSRLIGLQASCRGIDLDEALRFELTLFPLRCLKTLGVMRYSGGNQH